MKWNYAIMNPPYGSTGGDMIHLKFVDKCLEIANKQVSIFPFSFITKLGHKRNKQFKPNFDKYLISVEEVDSKVFVGTAMPNVGIYEFDNNKQENEQITINYINKEKNTKVYSLLDLKEFSDYEKNIVKYLENRDFQEGYWAGGHSHVTKNTLAKQGITDKDKVKKLIDDNIKENTNHLPKNKVYMITVHANGGMNGLFISTNTGNIFDKFSDLVNEFINRGKSSGYHVLVFNSVKEAENCKIALQNPILRFACYRLQEDQTVNSRCYSHIPAIDWSDDRVKTDEGLLEVCGCPKDKCKEYADYCKKIIDEVDKGNRPFSTSL